MITRRNILFLLFIFFYEVCLFAQVPQPLKQFLARPEMRGASCAILIKEVKTGQVLYQYDEERSLIPASVMKLVTTATALEILGTDFRFQTTLEYDGKIANGVLEGNLYIRGGGDPTLGSAYFSADRNNYHPKENTFIPEWIGALKKAGIRSIKGRVIADESIFDSEGVSRKWLYEDMGSYYGSGSYGISVFDNQYKLYLRTETAGSKPRIIESVPDMPDMQYHNYLTAAAVSTDSSYIMGAPFAMERFLYGVVPTGRERYQLRGDIPDPALFLADYLTKQLKEAGIETTMAPSCYRLLNEAGRWSPGERKTLATTYSPPLQEIAKVTNEVSQNLYADALLKTIGLAYKPKPGEVISSADRGVNILRTYWQKKGLNTSPLFIYDGSGLSAMDKLTASFICDLLIYMTNSSAIGTSFIQGIPQAGIDGSVRNFLRGSRLQGNSRLKSGSMTAVKSYAGYVDKDGKKYAVVFMVNNYTGAGNPMTRAIEQLILSLL